MKKTISLVLVFVLGLAIETANADFVFGTPTNLGPPVNSSYGEAVSSISSDGLALYFSSSRPGVRGLMVATRETVSDPWGEPVNLGPIVNGPGLHNGPSISVDELSLYFHSTRAGGYGEADIYVTTRETTEDDWGAPVNLGPGVNSSAYEARPSISADGLNLFFVSGRPGGYGGFDIWVTTRATKDDDWSAPVNLGPTINTSNIEAGPCISADDLVLFFQSDQPSGGGWDQFDLWMTKRPTTTDPWGPPVNLGPTVNSTTMDGGPNISGDGMMLFFFSTRPGGPGDWDLWQAQILPVVDFNGDAIVDVKDIAIMTEHWGENYTLCDIGPTPLGDGIVDVQDLEVLTEYIEPIDRTFIAHWALDEVEGDIAWDSAGGDNNAYTTGNPIWHPDGGKIGGALQFDGIDDYITTPFVLDHGEVSFSVFAWIIGSGPGQVIISQADPLVESPVGIGSTWLGTNQSGGKLMSGLMDAYFGSLESDAVITDGQWHHVGLVYDLDAMHRYLYVDGVEVAADTDFVGGLRSDGGLYIGTNNTLDASSFFSGLIDDVRIYRRILNAEEIAELAR
ncbi:MAG: LamG-like jellyroll fold domain-containing protein [Planctomycetota bacterium]